MKLTKTIVVKRTAIDTGEDEEGNVNEIVLRFLVYEEGNESATLGCDEDCWEFFSGEWTCRSEGDWTTGLPYGLWAYIGIDNKPLAGHILNSLVQNEYITVTYTTEVNIQPGHSLRTCGMCAFWENGKCSKVGEALPKDHIIPCDSLFKEKVTA